MQASDIFFNSLGRLRSGWRFLLFFIAWWIASSLLFGVSLLILMFVFGGSVESLLATKWGFVLQALILSWAALAIGYVCLRLLEDLPFKALGWALHKGWLRDWLVGSLVGAITLMLAALIATASGGLRFSLSEGAAFRATGKTLVLSFMIFVLAAAAEESFLRGYPLQTMTRAKLIWLGIALTSLVFALVHQGNPNLHAPNVLPGLAFANTTLAGVWLAVAYIRTRSLWLPLGIHWAWNWMMAAVLGLPVSGIKEITPDPLLHGRDLGPVWLTGGAYGIEAGVACTIALLFSTMFLWRTKLLTATEEMQALTSHEIPRQTAPADTQFRQDFTIERQQPPASDGNAGGD